jgi:four helix bundle protein
MRDHTSLLAWQEARATALESIRLCRDHWVPYGAAIFAQLQRASLSVQLNIAEGYAFTPSATLERHFRIAYGSAIETGDLLQILVDSDIVGRERCQETLSRNARTQRLLLGLLRSKRTPAQ